MKRNTYVLEQIGGEIGLKVCLGPKKTKLFDYGLARKDGNSFYWNGRYSDTPQAKEILEARLQELTKLNIRRDRKAEINGVK